MDYIQCRNSTFGRTVEFAEKNEFGYNHRTISIYIDKANQAHAVSLYTFRYGRALWLREGQDEARWVYFNAEAGKFIEKANLRVFVSLVGGIGDPDKIYNNIVNDLYSNITDIYLFDFLVFLMDSGEKDFPLFDPARYLETPSLNDRVKVGIRRKIQNLLFMRKRGSLKGLFF